MVAISMAKGSCKMMSQDQMIALNRRQAQFYDKIQQAEAVADRRGYSHNHDANFATRAFAELRYQQQRAVELAGIRERVRQAHLQWAAEKQGGNFLEIGCFSGSPYTFDLIDAAGAFTGIDLSGVACDSLREKIATQELSRKARIICGDFLEYAPERQFDFIYAHGVLHHFGNPEPLFSNIRNRLSDNGILVFVEPVSINPVFRALRSLYRPFQSDADWEWPFQKHTVSELLKRFVIADGFGWGRFSAPMSLLCGVPVIGHLALPAYQWIARKEIATASQPGYWLSSMVVAKCSPRALSR
jgi:SAM-dependent methyltransferase